MTGRALILLGVGVAVTLVDQPTTDPSRTPAGHVEHVLSGVALTVLVGVLGWVCAAVLLARLRTSAGLVGVLADVAWRLAVPPMLRLGISTAVGVAGIAAPSVALPAVALDDGGVTGPASSALAVERPRTCHETTCSPAGPSANAATASSAAHATLTSVVVRPGDSLWRIAERHLHEHADDAAVAAEWPRWYEANRAAIGPDPDLLRVGQVLHRPDDLVARA